MLKEIQHKLKRLRLAKAHNSENQCAVLHGLDIAVSCGEDMIVDLRKNNGSKPKFEKFWEV